MRAALLIALVGCSFPTRSSEYACETNADCDPTRTCDRGFCIAGTSGDGGLDAHVILGDAPDECTTFTSRHFDACMIVGPNGPLDLTLAGIYTYNTDTTTLTDPNGGTSVPVNQGLGAARLLSLDLLRIGATSRLRVVGGRPLIIASWSTITISGIIDASSNGTGPGPGANPTQCSTHAAAPGGNSTGGAGGGGGGGYRAAGGPGGTGQGAAGGMGGAAVPMLPLLLGGCAGGNGGMGNQAGGAGGAGGGAVQLTARLAVTQTGTIHAGGSGGSGAVSTGVDADGGGGGGGSGGMIGLEAPTVIVQAAAILAANGGGGGEGANTMQGGRGQDASASVTRALGGSGGDGGNGGLGSGGVTLVGSPGADDANNGAGGGGGGAGFIVVASANPNINASAITSPSVTVNP